MITDRHRAGRLRIEPAHIWDVLDAQAARGHMITDRHRAGIPAPGT